MFQYRVITTANGQDKENINKWETSILPENEWSYIVLTWNNKTGIKLYINGSLSSFIDAQWKIPEQTNPKTFFIKNNIGNKGATIDEYRIYNEDLTADEIKKYFMSE